MMIDLKKIKLKERKSEREIWVDMCPIILVSFFFFLILPKRINLTLKILWFGQIF